MPSAKVISWPIAADRPKIAADESCASMMPGSSAVPTSATTKTFSILMPFGVSAIFGISLWLEQVLDGRHRVNAADSAMYESKSVGRSTLRFYSPARDQGIRDRMELERRIRLAVERNDGLTAVYDTFIHGTPDRFEADCFYAAQTVKLLADFRGRWEPVVKASGFRE